MKSYLIVFISLLALNLNAQINNSGKYKSEPFGGDNTPLVINGNFNPFAYNYFRLLDLEFEFVGFYADTYNYTLYRDGKCFAFGFTNELKIRYLNEIKIPTDLKDASFIGKIGMGEFVYFIFEFDSDEITKNTRALCYVTLDIDAQEFDKPVIIETFDSKEKLNVNLIKSDNEKYMAFTIISESKKGLDYQYNFVKCDNKMKPILSQKNVMGDFKQKHFYESSTINNSGDVIIIFTENGGKFSKFSGVEMAHNYATIFTHQGVDIKENEIKLDKKRILDIALYNFENREHYFVSWCSALNDGKTGFSLLDSSGKMNEIFEFDKNWLEPFIQLQTNDFLDKTYSNSYTNELNAHYKVLDFVADENSNTYILEKNTDVEFYSADYGATIVTINNANTATTIHGDILIVQTDKSGNFKDTAKIERYLLNGINSGFVKVFENENQRDLVYSNLRLNDFNEVLFNKAYTSDATRSVFKGKPENYEFYVSQINTEMDTIWIETITLNRFDLSSKATQFVPFTETCSGFANDFMFVAFVEKGFQMLRFLY